MILDPRTIGGARPANLYRLAISLGIDDAQIPETPVAKARLVYLIAQRIEETKRSRCCDAAIARIVRPYVGDRYECSNCGMRVRS